jgi:hypothetical protein
VSNVASYINAGGTTVVGTATIASSVFTDTAHGLTNGTAVEFDTITGGAVGILIEGHEYFVRNATTDTYQVSDTPGGELMVIASGGAQARTAVPEYSAIDLRRLDAINAHPASADRLGARVGVRPHSTAAVTVSGLAWSVADTIAWMYPRETSTSGPYRVYIQATNGTLTAADGSNGRLDALDVYIQDDDEDGSGQRGVPAVLYTAGTPSSSPVAPTLLPGRLRLAVISVPVSGSPTPTSVQTPVQFSHGPGILPVRGTSEMPSAGMPEGAYIDRMDLERLDRWDGSAAQPVASQASYAYWLATTGGSAITGWTSYTPTWTGIGSATFSNNVGRWIRTGPKTVEFKFWAVVSTAGSGSSNVQVTAPFAPSRVMNQLGSIHVEGSPTPALRDGLWITFTSGTGTTIDRLRFDNGLGSVSNLVGSDLVTALAITGGGTIMEA